MRTLEDLNGCWKGNWVQKGQTSHQELRLSFAESIVEGHGNDHVGPFTIRGWYAPRTNVLSFKKNYSLYVVHYEGTWDGNRISGQWRIHELEFMDRGHFELWPDQVELEAGDESLALDDAEKG